MLSSTFTEMAKVSASEIDKYDEFGNTLKDASTTEYEDSCSLYDCESFEENDETNTEGTVYSVEFIIYYVCLSIVESYIRNSATTSKNLMRLSQNDYSEPSGQCRLLLVSLLDNFCSMYDRNPRKNQKLFSSLCRKLSSMGILKSLDFMDESKSIRSVYREAFKAIVVEAVKSIDNPVDLELAKVSSSHQSSRQSSDSEADGGALIEQHTFNHFLNNTSENSTIPANALGEEIFLSGRSRYREDFLEGAVLGRGGYGKVVVAVNKLDGNSYAIKKINFSGVSSTRFTRILREVKSLARLDHPNIVRYNSAWIEDHSVILERIESEDNIHAKENIVHELENVKHDFIDKLESLDLEDEDTFTSGLSSNSEEYESDRTHVFHVPSSHSQSNSGIHSVHISQSSHIDHVAHSHRFQFQDRKIMYIQMELCRFTLDQYIKARNAFYFECLEELKRTGKLSKGHHKMFLHDKTDRSYVIPAESLFIWNDETRELSLNPVELDSIFKGIVKGLHYIHENGMIHRDLKPMNIFFHHDLTPKIGDFGLVSEIKCSCGYNCVNVNDSEDFLGSSNSSNSNSGFSSPVMEHTKGVGTVTYASPEQLNQEVYTQKSDIYSLGIICFELFYPVATQMERTRILADLKHRHKFPESFLKQWPKEAAFIWSCIARDSEVRPSTQEILESEWLERDEDEIISRLESELLMARKREEELMRNLEELRKENLQLKRSLNK